jgi:hypothetical protein
LAGIVIGPNQRTALFEKAGKARAVSEGQAIGGWMVTSVERGGVTLSAAGQVRVIRLENMSGDAAEAARRRADEIARANEPALAASQQQDAEREEAMRDLAEATRRMTAP